MLEYTEYLKTGKIKTYKEYIEYKQKNPKLINKGQIYEEKYEEEKRINDYNNKILSTLSQEMEEKFLEELGFERLNNYLRDYDYKIHDEMNEYGVISTEIVRYLNERITTDNEINKFNYNYNEISNE